MLSFDQRRTKAGMPTPPSFPLGHDSSLALIASSSQSVLMALHIPFVIIPVP